MDIEGKIAVVTGGVSGLGLAVVEQLSKKGATVFILDINEDTSNLAHLTNCQLIKCDITDEKAVASSIDEIVKGCGVPQILVNSAGILHSEPMFNMLGEKRRHSSQNWRNVINTNLTATFVTSSIFCEALLNTRQKGVVVNISSIAAAGNKGQAAYSAAKAGVEGLTKSCGKELAPMGIRFVAVSPGFIDTPSTRKAVSESILKYVINSTPTRSLGTVEAITATILLAIKQEYLNACVIPVDGGLTI